ncbi:MAG: DegV family protein [Eggerthellaceae bacterium]|nr:DegV family protein [Eggerthellaceae bacterium]
MLQCHLIIDSCCDLPPSLVDLEGVTLLRFPYILDGEVCEDDMFRTQSAHDFYEAMRNGAEPSTSQLSMPVLKETFEAAIASGVPTVYLSFTSGLSGSFDVAMLIRDQVLAEHPEAELYVVDTMLPSIAEGILVYEAIRQRDKGLTAKELACWAEEAHYFVNEQFMVDDLKALQRGGRIPATVAVAGSALDVKPLLSVDVEGRLAISGMARGRKKGVKQLAEFYAKNRAELGLRRYALIGHSDCPKDVERLKDALLKVDADLMFIECNIGPVIGSHVGPGMIALSFWGGDKRENMSVADRIARKVKRGDM